MSRDYYNRRVGKDGERPRLELREVASQLAAAYRFVDQQGYLQRSFGYRCVDAGDVSGLHGTDICHTLYLDAGIKVTGHVPTFIEQAGDEAVVFTLVEFLHDHVAKPAEGAGSYHSFSNCGWHYDCRGDRFDEAAARGEGDAPWLPGHGLSLTTASTTCSASVFGGRLPRCVRLTG